MESSEVLIQICVVAVMGSSRVVLRTNCYSRRSPIGSPTVFLPLPGIKRILKPCFSFSKCKIWSFTSTVFRCIIVLSVVAQSGQNLNLRLYLQIGKVELHHRVDWHDQSHRHFYPCQDFSFIIFISLPTDRVDRYLVSVRTQIIQIWQPIQPFFIWCLRNFNIFRQTNER